jgi:hypothetical protein
MAGVQPDVRQLPFGKQAYDPACQGTREPGKVTRGERAGIAVLRDVVGGRIAQESLILPEQQRRFVAASAKRGLSVFRTGMTR